MRYRGILVAAAGAVALGTTPALAANQQVTATPSAQFLAKTVTVNAGETVTWTNAGGLHDVTFDDGSFKQPPQPSGAAWTVSRTFDTPGTHPYYCSVHGRRGGIGMAGTVVVTTAPQPDPGGSGAAPGSGIPPGPANGPASPVGAQGQQQSARPCASQRRFRIRIRQQRRVRIRSARVSVNGKRVRVRRLVIGGRLRHTAIVDLRGLGKGTYEVEIVATTSKGRRLRGKRFYRTCAPKLPSRGLPRL